jgi:alpha-beta hydrolase superfamily lysophospholipase
MNAANEADRSINSAIAVGSARAWHFWTCIAALSLGSGLTLLTRLFQSGSPDADWTLTSVLVLLSSGLAGGFSWWLLVSRPRLVTEVRGALAGALAAILSYLLVFQAANLVYGAAVPEFFGASLSERLIAGVILSLVTLLFSGWFSIPILALIGALLAMLHIATLPDRRGGVWARMRGFVDRSLAFLSSHPLVRAGFVALSVGALGVSLPGAWIWTRPLQVNALQTQAAPVDAYAAGVAAIREAIAAEAADPTLNPACASRLIEQGRQAARVVVFFHGFTNCPAQFVPLAAQFAARGYNVYIPRLPRHGYADRLTGALEDLSAEELVRFADRSVDLASSLGDEVVVFGLSGGGNLAAWIAQERADVAQAILVAPMLHVEGLPPFSIRAAASTILAIPNFYLWWDSSRREQALGPPYAYPRYPVHAIGAFLRLSFAVQSAANQAPPAVREILVVSNAADTAVSNSATAAVADAWARKGAAVRRFVFPAELGLDHDVIDVNQPKQRVDVVYPTLITLIEEAP